MFDRRFDVFLIKNMDKTKKILIYLHIKYVLRVNNKLKQNYI